MFRLLLLLILIPLAELLILIEVGQRIGTLPTIALVFITGLWGAWLARRQGLEALERARYELSQGMLPAEPVMDGILILLAGVLLVTPGVLTDLIGFMTLIPATRHWIKRIGWKMVQRRVHGERIQVRVHTAAPGTYDSGESHLKRDPAPPGEDVKRVYPVLIDRSSDDRDSRH